MPEKIPYLKATNAGLKNLGYSTNLLQYTNEEFHEVSGIAAEMEELNLLFSKVLMDKRPDLKRLTPYEVKLSELVPKNQWTQGHYVALNYDDGTLELKLNFDKIEELAEFPIYKLTWVLFHELRHKIQLENPYITSFINYPNWKNFKAHMMEMSGKDEDLINHIFHEMNPAEVDAHIFACEMTETKFAGNSFDVTPESLSLLEMIPNEDAVIARIRALRESGEYEFRHLFAGSTISGEHIRTCSTCDTKSETLESVYYTGDDHTKDLGICLDCSNTWKHIDYDKVDG